MQSREVVRRHPLACALGALAVGSAMAAFAYSRRSALPEGMAPLTEPITRRDAPPPSVVSSIDACKSLEEGIEITPDMFEELRECIPAVARSKPHPAVIELSYLNYRVFKLTKYPHIVFKMPRHDGQNPHERFENMVQAAEVCFRHQLNRLRLPKAKKIEVTIEDKNYCLIAEQCIKLKDTWSKPYLQHSKRVQEAVRQLAIFIVNTGFYDVKPANIPLCDSDDPDWSIALIDTETCRLDTKHITAGFLGHFNGSKGLLECVSREHIPMVLEIARGARVVITEQDLKHVFKALASDEAFVAFLRRRDAEANR